MTAVSLTSQETVATTLPDVKATLATPATDSKTLSTYFTDPNVPGTIATFETSKGNIEVALTDTATPISVANFLGYVNSGAYDNTVFDKSVSSVGSSSNAASGSTPSDPGVIVQGGGNVVGATGLTPIATTTPIENYEAGTGALSNVEDTLAFANTGAATSVTSEFFFNNADNSATFDGVNTVFGHILSGQNVLTAIASLPTASLNTTSFPTVPITGLTTAQITAMAAVTPSNLVYTYAITTQAGTTYTAVSSDPSLVTPTISAGVLSFKYATGGTTGTADVTVTATNAYDGTSATQSFAVTVPPASSTTTGPVTTADTIPLAVTGTAATVYPLDNDTDATAALSPTTLAIATQPTHGTATVNPTTGQVTYTSVAGYTGTDSFTYTVSDDDGNAAPAPATVTVTVVPTPTVVDIGGTNKVKSVTFTQPDGARGHLALTSGSAVVTFSPGDTTTKTANGVETVTGAGATVSSIAITNAKQGLPSLTITSAGKGGVTVGGITDGGPMVALVAPTTTLTGTSSFDGLALFDVGAASHASITIGGADGITRVTLPTAVDSSLFATVVSTLSSRKWTVDDTGSYVLAASSITNLSVTGAFADALELSGSSGYALTTAHVAAASAPWELNGAIKQATVTAPTSAWSLADGSLVKSLTVHGDLTSNVQAADITDMAVTGSMTGGSVQTTALYNSTLTQLQRLTIAGAMTDSTVTAVGNIGTVTARSMSGSHVYAGANSTIVGDGGLPESTSDLSAQAAIQSVTLTAGKATFADSDIGAYTLGRVRLGRVAVAAGGPALGVSAHALSALSATLDPGGGLVLGAAQLKSETVLQAYLTKQKKAVLNLSIFLY